jgi:AcrR family transcriptional regulator
MLRQPRQSRSRRLVDMVLASSAALVAERGLAGLSTNAVADHAGISVGSIYQYFPDKAALVQTLRAGHLSAMAEAIEATWQLAAPVDLHESVQALVRGQFAAHEVAPALHAALEAAGPFMVMPRAGDDAAHGAIWLRWRRLLAAHRDELVASDLDLAAWVALLTTDALAHAAVLGQPPLARLPFTLEAAQDAAVQAVWAGLTGGAMSPLRQRGAELNRISAAP